MEFSHENKEKSLLIVYNDGKVCWSDFFLQYRQRYKKAETVF